MKVVLVGDLRTIHNYGAIATSTALIALLEKIMDINLEVIDGRRFWDITLEMEGADGTENCSKNDLLKMPCWNKKKFLHVFKRKVKPNKTTMLLNKGIPCRYEDFAIFAEGIVLNKYLSYEYSILKDADIIIFNSEGCIVSGTDERGMYRRSGLYILFMEYFAKVYLHKPCHIINHTVDPHNRDIQNMIQEIYPKMDSIYVRENMSLALLEKWGIKNVKKVPDALFSYHYKKNRADVKKVLGEIDIRKPYICLGDSSGIVNRYGKVKWDIEKTYDQIIYGLKKICPQIVFVDGYDGTCQAINNVIKRNHLPSVNLSNCSHEQLYSVLAGSEIFISGRWHASIIALLGKTPILLWGADSHKTEALYGEIDYPFKFFDIASLPIHIDSLCEETKKILRADLSNVWKQVDKYREEAIANLQFLVQ